MPLRYLRLRPNGDKLLLRSGESLILYDTTSDATERQYAAEGVQFDDQPTAYEFAAEGVQRKETTTAAAGNTLTADTGAFTLAGTDTGLTADRSVSVDTGEFTLTGTANDLAVSKKVAAETGSLAVAGDNAELI